MNQHQQTTFAPLKTLIEGQDLHDTDLLTIIGSWVPSEPSVAQAMAFHARDYIETHGHEDLDYAKIISEVHRLVFFDEQGAAKYGTDWIASSPTQLEQLTACIIRGFETGETPNAAHIAAIVPTPTSIQ